MEPQQQKPGMNGTPIRATLGDIPGAREVLAKRVEEAPRVEPKREVITHELGAGSSAILSSMTDAVGNRLAAALDSHALAMRELAKAISGMPAATEHGGAPKAPRIDPVGAAIEKKVLEVIGKFSGLASSEIHVLVTTGAGEGAGVKVSKPVLVNVLTKLSKDEKVSRTGSGGVTDPYRYFLAATD